MIVKSVRILDNFDKEEQNVVFWEVRWQRNGNEPYQILKHKKSPNNLNMIKWTQELTSQLN